jgi:hypothetical protein
MEKIPTFIYETAINKVIIDKVSESRQEDGKTVTVTKDVEKIKPIKLAILKPNRKLFKQADIFFAKRLAFYLKEGLMPYSLVSKRYLNDGGVLTEDAKIAVKTFRERLVFLQTEYFDMKQPLTEENKKRRLELISEINQINRVLSEFENSYQSLFDNTAEVKTKNDSIEYWITALTMIDNDDGKGYVPFFGVGDYEARDNKLEELENLDDKFIHSIINKASYLVSFWYSSGLNLKPEDYKSAEESYDRENAEVKEEEVVINSVPETPKPTPSEPALIQPPVETVS